MRVAGLLALTLALSAPACEPTPPPEAAPAAQPLPPGDALPPRVESMLFGSSEACRLDAECPSTLCYFGTCVGVLVVDQRWMQEQATQAVVAAVERQPELRERVVEALVRVLRRQSGDTAFQGRALLPLEALGATDALAQALTLADERLQAAAALGLTRLGDPRGLPMAAALTESAQPALAAEAIWSLGRSRQPDALPPLLRYLHPETDRTLLRATLSALGELGDRRAVRPLVAFLDEAPESLQVRVATSLRLLTDAPLGRDPEAWRAWVDQNAPPAPPAYEVRVPEPDGDFLPPP